MRDMEMEINNRVLCRPQNFVAIVNINTDPIIYNEAIAENNYLKGQLNQAISQLQIPYSFQARISIPKEKLQTNECFLNFYVDQKLKVLNCVGFFMEQKLDWFKKDMELMRSITYIIACELKICLESYTHFVSSFYRETIYEGPHIERLLQVPARLESSLQNTNHG